MENPNTRPYTAEELEALFNEEAPNSDIPKNNKVGKSNPDPVILPDNNIAPIIDIPAETLNPSVKLTTEKPQTTSKLQIYAPFIILGMILTGVGIYLYYDYRKKRSKKMQKPKNE